MSATVNDPDIHLQCFNNHGIFTLDELNQLSNSVKPQLSALHLNIRSFNQHFDEFKNLLDSVPFSLDFVVFKPLTHIINLSLIQGKFPDSLKIAEVVPIFKQGSRLLCTNYRPISVLPVLSKIVEKCVPLSVDNIFGMISPLLSALGLPRNCSEILSSNIIYLSIKC